MSLFITSLNSGSNGNCYYIGNDREAILIDAGISCRETEKRMKRLNLSMTSVKAIFVSHEHTDHIKGIPIIAKKYQLPVYITANTLQQGRLELDAKLVLPFKAWTPITIGELNITAFPKFHDAIDPHSFMVESKGIRIGVFTDIGAPCERLIHHFQQCHAAFLEANYDEEMLEKGSYPYHLKNRIRGGEGHLSNRQALELFLTHRPTFLSHLLLSHLSHNNNCPDLTRELFTPHAEKTKIIIAYRHEETAVYRIEPTESLGPVTNPQQTNATTFSSHSLQVDSTVMPTNKISQAPATPLLPTTNAHAPETQPIAITPGSVRQKKSTPHPQQYSLF